MMISACPPLDELEIAPLRAATRTHVDSCAACRLVLEAFSDEVGVALCERFDALLAAHNDGTLNAAGENLLARHLAGCETCRIVAETLSPGADRDGDHARLPSVDPASYALGLEVARGGMGRIIAARDLRVGRPVAVKELLGSSPQLAARFEREARVTARLQHPGIVPIYEIGKWPDGTPFYTMRMVEGSTLREAIAEAPTLAQRLALLPAVIAASEAIAFAHAQRIIHRDLTPSNVLVGAYGETVVIDWGLAKDLRSNETDEVVERDPYRTATEPTGLTNAGSVIGTVVYMPPEQAHATAVDERADVYALGAILYHLLAGVAPYEGGTSAELLAAVKRGVPRAIEEIVPTAPRDLVSIVDKAMARSPEERYPSARELTNELKRFSTGNMVDAHAYSRVERVARFVRKHRNAVVVTLGAAIIIAVVGAIAVTRTVRSRNEAKATARELLFEKGRVELLDGNTLESLAYLDAVATSGPRSPALDFLINAAIRDAKPSSLVDCGGTVFAMALSPDGESLVAACGDHARIWRLRDRAPVASLGPFADGFYGVTYSADGAKLATWGRDGKVRVWNAHDGAPGGTYEHGGQLTIATFSPRGDRVLTSGSDGFARVWELASGKQLRAIEATDSLLLRLVWARYSADGTQILTITIEGKGTGWDAETGTKLGFFEHGGLVLGGDLSRDGRLATSCGIDRITRVWNATTGAAVLALAGHTDVVWRCVFDETGTRVLTTGHDGRANLWDLADGALVTSVDHGDILWTGSLSRDGRRFATIGVDGRVKVWDARSGALLTSHDSRRGKDATFTPDGRALVVVRGDGQIEIWDETSTQPTSVTPEIGGAILAVASDGSRTVVEDRAGWISFVDLAANQPAIGTHLHAPAALATTANTVAAIRADTDGGGVAIVALATGATVATLPIGATPSGLAMSADGARVAATSDSGATVWDVAAHRAVSRLDGASVIVLAGDGRRALAWHSDGDAPAIWDVDRGVQIVKLAIAGPRRAIGFSAGGDRVAILEAPVDAAQVVSIWNATSGERVFGEPATSATIDPSGRWLTTIRADGHVTVRALSDGHELASFVAEHLLQAQVDRDGVLVAAIGDHGRAAIVLATDGRVLARWPLEHAAPTVTQTGFRPPLATAAWSTDGTKIITHAKAVAVWHTASAGAEPLSSVMRRVPWRIVNGRPVVLRDRHLAVRVLAKGVPVAKARVSIQIRIAPDVGGADLHDWDAIRTRYTSRTVESTGDGTIVLDDLAPGSYTLTVVGNNVTRTFEVSVPADPANDTRLDVDLMK